MNLMDKRDNGIFPATPKISVIVLTYNQERTIAATLDSILSQHTSYPFEIIIGEDGSQDATRDVCERYARRYPDTIRLMPKADNKGIVDNYFDCFEAARGEYIADCAGDDTWADPHKLQRQCSMLETTEDVTIVYSAWRKIFPDRHSEVEDYGMTQSALIPGRQLIADYLAQKTLIVLSTAMYRAATLRNCMRRDSATVRNPKFACEDMPLICALLNCGNGMYDHHVTLDYRLGDDTLSNPSSGHRAVRFYYRTLRATCTLADHYHISTPEVKSYCSRQANYTIALAAAASDRTYLRDTLRLSRKHSLHLTWKSRLRLCVHLVF